MPSTKLPGGEEYPDSPPWDDLPAADVPSESEPVIQPQHLAFFRMVKSLAATLREQDIRITALEAGRAAGQTKPDNTQGDKLASGKHAGKTRDWVVKNAPDYLVYLDDNGWATTRWGFTAEQIAAAKANPLLPVLQKRR